MVFFRSFSEFFSVQTIKSTSLITVWPPCLVLSDYSRLLCAVCEQVCTNQNAVFRDEAALYRLCASKTETFTVNEHCYKRLHFLFLFSSNAQHRCFFFNQISTFLPRLVRHHGGIEPKAPQWHATQILNHNYAFYLT